MTIENMQTAQRKEGGEKNGQYGKLLHAPPAPPPELHPLLRYLSDAFTAARRLGPAAPPERRTHQDPQEADASEDHDPGTRPTAPSRQRRPGAGIHRDVRAIRSRSS